MSDEVDNENTLNLEEGDFNLNADDYSYNEAIQLFNILPNDDMVILNKKYNTLRDLYSENQEYLNFIDELYLKILNENKDREYIDEDEDENEGKEERKGNYINDNDNLDKNFDNNDNLEYLRTNRLTNLSSRQTLNLNNKYNQKFAVNQITPNITHELLCIDSNFKKLGETSSDFMVELPHPIHNAIQMKISSIEIPQTEYFFSEEKRNNVFYLIINYNRGNKQGTFDNNKDWIYVDSNNPTYAVIKIKIPNGIWYSADMQDFINDLLDTAHGPFQNLIKFEINTFSGKATFKFKVYDELTQDQKVNIESADIYSNFDQSLNYLPINPDDSDVFGPDAFFALSIGKTFDTGNDNDKIYNNITDINNDILKGDGLTPDLFLYSSLYSFGFTMSQIYDNDLNLVQINKNSKNLTSLEKENVSVSSINDIYLYYLEGNNIYAFNKLSYSYLAIEDYVGNFMTHINVWNGVNSRMTNKNIIARVQTSAPGFTVSLNNNSDQVFKQRNYFGPVTIKKLHIELLNSFGDHINLNSNNLSLILEFVIIYNSQTSESYQNILIENLKKNENIL